MPSILSCSPEVSRGIDRWLWFIEAHLNTSRLAILRKMGMGGRESEAADLVRTQGMSQAEAAQVLAVWVMTVHRRLSCGLQLLAATLGDLYPGDVEPDAP